MMQKKKKKSEKDEFYAVFLDFPAADIWGLNNSPIW